MNSDEYKVYKKVVDLVEIYNFVFQTSHFKLSWWSHSRHYIQI